MKKVLSLIVAVMMIASISISGFAAGVALNSVYKATDAEGKDYIITVGTLDYTKDEKPDDIGIIISGEKYSLIKDEDDEFSLIKAMAEKKYGIGIYDGDNLLGDSYDVIPYITVGDSDITGEKITVKKADYKSDNAKLRSLTLTDDAILYPEFSGEVYEYYAVYPEGEAPDAIPQVSYTTQSKDATAGVSTEGHITTVTVTAEDGKIKEYKIRPAEYTEITLTADKMLSKKTAEAFTGGADAGIPLPFTGTGIASNNYLVTLFKEVGGNSIIKYFNFNTKDSSGNYIMSEDIRLVGAELTFYARHGTSAYQTPEYTTVVVSKTDEDILKDGYTKPKLERIDSTEVGETEVSTLEKGLTNYADLSQFNKCTVTLDPFSFHKRTDLMLAIHKKDVHGAGSEFLYSPRIALCDGGVPTLTVKYVKETLKSSNTNLEAVTIPEGAELYPEFSKDITDYYVLYPEGQAPEEIPQIMVEAESSYATVNEKTEGKTKTFVVTAENGKTKKYTVKLAEIAERTLVADKMTTKSTSSAYSSANELTLPCDTSGKLFTTITNLDGNSGGNSSVKHFNFNVKDTDGNYVMPESFVLTDAWLSVYARGNLAAYETPEYRTLVVSRTDEDWTQNGYTKQTGLIESTELAEVEVYTKDTKVTNWKLPATYNHYNLSLNPTAFTERNDLMLTFTKKEGDAAGTEFVSSPYIGVNSGVPVTLTVRYIKEDVKSSDANLEAVTIPEGSELYPKFSMDVTDYYVLYPEGQAPEVIPEISAVTSSPYSTVTKKAEGKTTTITVTAEDGSTKEYKVTLAEIAERALIADKMATKQTNQVYNAAANIELPYTGSTGFNHHTTLKTLVSDISGGSLIRHFNFNIKDENGNYVMPEELEVLDASLSLYARSDTVAYETPEYTTLVVSKTDEDWTREDFAKASGQKIASTELTEVKIYTKDTAVSNYKLKETYDLYNISLDAAKFTKNTDLMLSFHKKEVHTEGGFKDCPRILIGSAGPVTLNIKYIKK